MRCRRSGSAASATSASASGPALQRHQDPGGRGDDLRHAADPGGDRRHAGGHGPQQRGRGGAVPAGVQGHVGGGQQAGRARRWRCTNRTWASSSSLAATRDSSQGRSGPSPASATTSGVPSGSSCDRVQQQLVPLVAAHRRGAQREHVGVPDAQGGAAPAPGRAGRRARIGDPVGHDDQTFASDPDSRRYHSRCAWEMAIVRLMNRCRARMRAVRLSRSTRSAGWFSTRCSVDTTGSRQRSAAAAPTTSAGGRWVCSSVAPRSRSTRDSRGTARGSHGRQPQLVDRHAEPAQRAHLGGVGGDASAMTTRSMLDVRGGAGQVDQADLGAVGVQAWGRDGQSAQALRWSRACTGSGEDGRRPYRS